MSSKEIQALLQPPNANDSRDRVHSFLNSKYPTVVHLVDLEATIEQALVRKQSLGSQVRVWSTLSNGPNPNQPFIAQLADSQPRIDALASESRVLAATHVQSAHELSLRRQSLSDELVFLSRDLVSTYSEGGSKPTILEEVETLHRNLKELESVKGYMQIIEHALKLRCVQCSHIRRARKPQTGGEVRQLSSKCEARPRLRRYLVPLSNSTRASNILS
jgi:RAD50-interacting protein 1